jgi:hypothetical protein
VACDVAAPDDGASALRDYVPTVRIRHHGLIKLWFRGPRMPLGPAVACLVVALVAGLTVGVMLRVGTQVAFEARLAGSSGALASR